MKQLNEIKWNDILAIPKRNNMARAYSILVILVELLSCLIELTEKTNFAFYAIKIQL